MNEKMKQLEQILTDFDNKLTDYYLACQLEEKKKKKEQAKILNDMARLVSAITYENLITCDEDMLKQITESWRKDMVANLYALRNTIK